MIGHAAEPNIIGLPAQRGILLRAGPELVYCFEQFGESVCSRKALGRSVVPECSSGCR